MKAIVAITLGVLALPHVAAQDVEGGCIQSNPCEWLVSIDDEGFDGTQLELNGTSGDWFVLDVFNFGEATQQVDLSGHGIVLSVPSVDSSVSEPFSLGAAGTYALTHQSTGDALPVVVDASEQEDAQASTAEGGDARQTPGMAVPAALGALAIAAMHGRRISK